MNLEEEITKELADKMQSEMDFHILSDMLVQSCGWHKVTLSRFRDNHHAIDIRLWCEEHIKHPFESRGASFVFENQGDAINFTLKWAD